VAWRVAGESQSIGMEVDPMERAIRRIRRCGTVTFAWFEQEGVATLERIGVVFLKEVEAAANHVDEFPRVDDPGGVRTVAAGYKPSGEAGADPGRWGSFEVHRRNRIVFMGNQCLV